MDKAAPVLGTQPPLPGAVPVRYVDVALDEGVNPHQDLVPVGMYYEEKYPFSDYPAEPADDFQQVMMIGQRPNNCGRGQPMGRGQSNLVQTLGPCFKCGGETTRPETVLGIDHAWYGLASRDSVLGAILTI